jgi:hypothetical protein
MAAHPTRTPRFSPAFRFSMTFSTTAAEICDKRRVTKIYITCVSNAANSTINLLIIQGLLTENRKPETENGIRWP